VALLFYLMGTNIGVLRLRGNGMSPTVQPGELVVYSKRPDAAKLTTGRLIAFRTSSASAWGKAGNIVLGRIMAVPTDALSIDDRQYLVNGRTGPKIATTGEFKPVLEVPPAPRNLRVPDNCYFVCQDDTMQSYDSRVLSWTRKEDIIATDLFLLGSRGFGRRGLFWKGGGLTILRSRVLDVGAIDPGRLGRGIFFGFRRLALLFGDQPFAVGDRDLEIVGMDFREGQEAVAVAAIFHERRLQRRFDANYFCEIDVPLERAAARGLEVEFSQFGSIDDDHPGLFGVAGIDEHAPGHGLAPEALGSDRRERPAALPPLWREGDGAFRPVERPTVGQDGEAARRRAQ